MVQDLALDFRFLMIKYGFFLIAGLIGSVGSIAFTKYDTHLTFIKSTILGMILAVVGGIIAFDIFKVSIEVSFGASILVSLFSLKITKEIIEFIDSFDQLGKDFVSKKIDDEKVEDIKTEDVVEEENVENNLENTK